MKKFLSVSLAILISGLLPVSIAFADNVTNDVVVGGTDTFTVGGSSTVGYKIVATNNDGERGCNAADATPATVIIHTPAGVVASNPSVFSSCNSFHNATFTSSTPGNYSITVSVSDTGAGGTYNTNPATFTLHVLAPVAPADVTPPVLTLPADMTVEATSASGAAVTFSATATDANPANPAVSCAPVSGSVFPIGATIVNCSATDAAGNTAHGSFNVTVQDTTPPAISSFFDVFFEATGPDGAMVLYTTPTASDAVDGLVSVSCNPASGSTFGVGNTPVACSATDAHGNASHSDFHVVVTDTTAPILVVPGPMTAEATGPEGAQVDFSVAASDVVDGIVPVVCDHTSGDVFPLGHTTMNCTATDHAGNSTSSFFDIFVEDTTPPDIATNPDMTIEATSPAGAAATFSNPSATDLVDTSVDVSCDHASGSVFAFGHTKVTCTATDDFGNHASSFFDVFVVDTIPPVVTCASTDGVWHASDALIHCTASDSGSGVSPVDASFDLSTHVPSGTETADAPTESRNICDVSSNCAVAGPIGGNKIDKRAATISITTPAAVSYTFHQTVLSGYSCVDGGSGVSSCVGLVPNGSAIDTSSLGSHHFTVHAIDGVGNSSDAAVDYSVVYNFGGILQPINANGSSIFKFGSTVPVKFQLRDANGNFVTNAVASITVAKLAGIVYGSDVEAISTAAATTGNLFRYDAIGNQYIFNLATKPLSTGTFRLKILLDDGTSQYVVISLK